MKNIYLTDYDLDWCTKQAISRTNNQGASASFGPIYKEEYKNDPYLCHLDGIKYELAAEKWIHQYLGYNDIMVNTKVFSSNDYFVSKKQRGRDLGIISSNYELGYEVRGCDNPEHNLLVYEKDYLEAIYILMERLQDGSYVAVGWNTGIKPSDTFKNHRDGKNVFKTYRNALQPMEQLPRPEMVNELLLKQMKINTERLKLYRSSIK